MKIKKIIEHLEFGVMISGLFGILSFVILLFPVFFSVILLEKILRIIGFTLFEVGLFIFGVMYSINDEKEQEQIKSNN